MYKSSNYHFTEESRELDLFFLTLQVMNYFSAEIVYLLHSSLVIIFESFDCGAVHIDELASTFHRTHEERPMALRLSESPTGS